LFLASPSPKAHIHHQNSCALRHGEDYYSVVVSGLQRDHCKLCASQ
jgi:hypothetical protein